MLIEGELDEMYELIPSNADAECHCAERVVGDGIDDALLKNLTRTNAKPNENYMLGVALAVRLGLERVYAVDDHTADSIEDLAGSGFEEAIQKVWHDGDNPAAKEIDRRENAVATDADMLALYRYVNEPASQRPSSQ